MVKIQHDISLQSFNSFGIDVKTQNFASFKTEEQLLKLLASDDVEKIFQNKTSPETNILILGSGSNVLFTQDFPGLVLKNEIEGIEVVHTDDEYTYVKAGGGVGWHDFVLYCVNNNLGGVENLSLIPGTVGAAPIQNIGAYGVELKDVLHTLTCLDIQEKEWVVFSAKDCDFGYRSSVFKTKLKNRVVITSVTFRLTKKHQLHLEYGAIKDQLFAIGVISPTIKDISDAVIAIRTSKLPDPKLIGNAGSFFKNPVVTETDFLRIKEFYPDLVSNPAPGGYKLAAGWLIEKTGWKGYREGHVGCYQKQALVLVNYGGAAGHEIVELSQKIQASVLDKFGVALDAEVNFI